MCNCNQCGCSLANAINNLFDTSSWFNGNGGCGCNNYNRGFVNGVNTVNNIVNGNGGCGCGSNGDLSAYTACDNQCFDPYYAAQYGYFSGCSCAYNNLF